METRKAGDVLSAVVTRRGLALALANEVVQGMASEFGYKFTEIVASVALGTPVHPVDDSGCLIDHIEHIPHLTDATRDRSAASLDTSPRTVAEFVTYALADHDFASIDHALLAVRPQDNQPHGLNSKEYA
ncbi:hypothetical protein CMI37_12540 [Candidatus Pacearchaeota archaeon]|nr:hypothetical protein [Candidatus Pacearchaeota archaeon]